jgi:uncharacterized protein YbjT (DUF2867 family)
MKILLTGVTGYIAQRLLPVLLENGHQVICCVRDKNRFQKKNYSSQKFIVIEADFLNKESLQHIPNDIDVAYYLIHSMSTQTGDFDNLEEKCATNFKNRIEQTTAKQVIYLSGISNAAELSKHLSSRKKPAGYILLAFALNLTFWFSNPNWKEIQCPLSNMLEYPN